MNAYSPGKRASSEFTEAALQKAPLTAAVGSAVPPRIPRDFNSHDPKGPVSSHCPRPAHLPRGSQEQSPRPVTVLLREEGV